MYLPLRNYKYDSGPNRIQSGPDHEGYIVLTSGVQSAGADQGFIVDGSPLSGNVTEGAWGYDGNWRYVPLNLPGSAYLISPTAYNPSGALGTYDALRVSTVVSAAGTKLASSIGPDFSTVSNPSIVPPKYLYYGGNAPSNQDYSPFNTPGSNTAAEGKTGGGVTHGIYEGTALTNILGSQGTSDRSQWRYHQPVYCKTYTETVRSTSPGLMSSPLRYTYRGESTIYSLNYGNKFTFNKGGFTLLQRDYPPYGTTGGGTLVYSTPLYVDRVVTCAPVCAGARITWYRVNPATGERTLITQGLSTTYTVTLNDDQQQITADVECPEPFLPTGYGPVGNAGITSIVDFNPFDYNYVRFSGVWNSVSQPSYSAIVFSWTPTQSLVTPGTNKQCLVVGDIGNCNNPLYRTIPCQQLVKWGANFYIELDRQVNNQFCKNAPINFRLYRASDDLSSIDYFNGQGGISATACVLMNPNPSRIFFASMYGVYQFSNNQSTVLREWTGRQPSF